MASENDFRLYLRLPTAFAERIKQQAETEKRTLNAHLNVLLEIGFCHYLPNLPPVSPGDEPGQD